jgi:hypothetical protein
MSSRDFPGVKDCCRHVRLTISLLSVSWLSRKCGSLNVWQPYGFPQPVTGIASPFFSAIHYLLSSSHLTICSQSYWHTTNIKMSSCSTLCIRQSSSIHNTWCVFLCAGTVTSITHGWVFYVASLLHPLHMKCFSEWWKWYILKIHSTCASELLHLEHAACFLCGRSVISTIHSVFFCLSGELLHA